MFYDSKLYFYLLVELMCFVFIIIETESLKLRIMESQRLITKQNYEFLVKKLESYSELRTKFLSTLKEK